MSLLTLVLVTFTWAASLLDPAGPYPLGPSKDPAPKAKRLESQRVENRILYESFAGSEAVGTPIMSSETKQELEGTPLESKEAGIRRTQLLFRKFKISSRAQLPGAKKPFVTEQDLGALLFDHPLVIRREAGKEDSIENLTQVKEAALRNAGSGPLRSAVSSVFSDKSIRGITSAADTDPACLDQAAGRKPGDKWHSDRSVGGFTFPYACEFAGWSQAGDEKITVFRFSMPKQKNTVSQNGQTGVTETETSGTIYQDPKTGEIAMNVETGVFAQPTEQVVEAHRRRGEAVPQNRTVVRTWTHVTPVEASPKAAAKTGKDSK